jgi:hypothetical protein
LITTADIHDALVRFFTHVVQISKNKNMFI